MRILFVSKSYYPSVGGIETQLRLVANELSNRNRVEVATTSLGENFSGVASTTIRRLDIRTLLSRLKIWGLLRRVKNSLLLSKSENFIDGNVPVSVVSPSGLDRLRLLRDADIDDINWRRYERSYRSVYLPKLRGLVRGKDVVHSVADGYLGWAAEEAARLEGIPFVITPYVHPGGHGADPDNIALYQRADIVFALLETGAQRLIELGVDRRRLRLLGVVPLVPNTTDADGFRAAFGIGHNPMVLFVGRMIEYKGPLALLKAADYVWREMPNVHFVFAGPSGPLDARSFTEMHDNRIRYLGQISEQEKGNAMAACDVFCMPSVEEILPAVYLEAWSYGKPVIGGTAYGLRELIEGNDAGIVAEQNPETLAAELVKLLRDEPRRMRMGERGRALVTNRFTETALVRALEETYQSVLAEKPARPSSLSVSTAGAC